MTDDFLITDDLLLTDDFLTATCCSCCKTPHVIALTNEQPCCTSHLWHMLLFTHLLHTAPNAPGHDTGYSR